MEDLLKAWEKNYQRLEDARNRKTTRLQSVKMNARALQLKYCIKALREQLTLTDVVKSLPTKKYEIDFGGDVKCGLEITKDELIVIGAMNGWGNGISKEDIIITTL